MLLEPTLYADDLPDRADVARPAPPAVLAEIHDLWGHAAIRTMPRGAYGNDAGRWPAALASTAIVAGLFSMLVWMNVVPAERHLPAIVAVNLTIDPPRPDPQPKPQAHTAPTPKVATPTPAMPVVQTPVPPAAVIPVTVAPAPAPVAPPAPVAAPAPAPAPAPVHTGPADVGDMSSRMLSFTAPEYPYESRAGHEQGTVVLTLVLGTDGRVSQIGIDQSSGHARLDQAALAAVRKWRWKPILRDGQPVMVRGTVRIPFVLKS